MQHNYILRFIPLFIKDIVIRNVGRLFSQNGATIVLSNLGIIKVPDEIKAYIDKFDLITYNDDFLPLKVGVCSFDDKLSIAFSSLLVDTEIQKYFFNFLTKENIDIVISSSMDNISRGDKKHEIL